MWYWFGGLLAIVWISLLLVMGLSTYAKGHKALFWFGIIFPVLWVIGALMAPRDEAAAAEM